MFTGIDFEKAIDYYRKGKEVIVLDRASVGKNGKSGYDTFPFEELQVDSEEIIQAVHETQGSITPPREAGGKDGRRNDRSSGGQYRR